MNMLNAILLKLNIIVWGLAIVVSLEGCSASGNDRQDTGAFECVGYCTLQVNRSEVRVETQADGTVIETAKKEGIIPANDKNKVELEKLKEVLRDD